MPTDIFLLLKSILLTPQDRNIVGGTGAPVLVVAWTLQYEILFYTVFTTALVNKWLLYLIVTIFMINYFLEPTLGPYNFPRNFLSNHLIFLFGIGMIASKLTRSNLKLFNPERLAILSTLIFAIIAVIAINNKTIDQKTVFDFTYGIVSSILIFSLASYDLKKTNTIQSSRSTTFSLIGDSSYAPYLIHFPLIAILSKVSILVLPINEFGATLAFIFLVSTSIIMAMMFTFYLEKPLLLRLALNAKKS